MNLKKKVIILSAMAIISGIILTVIFLIQKSVINKKVMADTTTTYSETTQQQAVKPSEIATAPTQTAVLPTFVPTEIVSATETMTMEVVEIPTEYFTVKTIIPTEHFTQPITQHSTTEPSEPEYEIPLSTEEPTEIPTQNTEQSFEKLLSRSGYQISEIENSDIQQLIIVDTYGVQAELHLFTKKDDVWENDNISCDGFIGVQGNGTRNADDEQVTPKGMFKIGDCFYQNEQPTTWLNTFRITEHTYWIDDLASDWYNQKIETENTDNLPTARYMAEDDKYRYGFVIEYNTTPVDKEKGTAVFMYCGDTATTDGGIAVEEENMLQYLSYLNTAKNPHIIIF